MSRQAPQRDQLPVAQKLRVRYAKRGRLRFASHRDVQRALERAVRRAGVPVAHSHGFTPHPKISYADAAPTGAASEAEYLEISLTRRWAPSAVRAALDDALPHGLDVLDVAEAGSDSLADRLQASRWRIVLRGVDPARVESAVETFLTAGSVEVERLTKSGKRRLDARGAVLAARVEAADSSQRQAAIELVVRRQSPVVRPEEFLAGLRSVAGLALVEPPTATRLAQGVWDETANTLVNPLAAGDGPAHG